MTARPARQPIVVFCELLDNESFCASVIRELEQHYEVLPCGPGWPHADPLDFDTTQARFYLELDSASGAFPRPRDRAAIACPTFAWLIDTHKKPDAHRQLSAEVDLSFYAMARWGHVLAPPAAWLPLHADPELFYPQERERDLDLVFVGSQPWRAAATTRIAKRHGLRAEIVCTTGPREKSQTAELYARAKLVFNRHVTNDLNFRVFEAMACGRVLLSDAQDNGQYELCTDAEHLVLYKDDADLERHVLELLASPARRLAIEEAAAAHFTALHTTRARVAELAARIEAHLVGITGQASEPALRLLTPTPPALASVAGKRIAVVCLGEDDPTAHGLSYGGLLADRLAHSGAEVTVFGDRPGDGRTPRVELSLAALPSPETDVSRALLATVPALAQLEAGLGEGSWDVIVGSGPFGALVAQPTAARRGIPFVAALSSCEVSKRKNRLTRPDLYQAQLEHWACDRAVRVWCPNAEHAAELRRHYRCARVDCVSPPPPVLRPEADDVVRLLALLPTTPRWAYLAPFTEPGPGPVHDAPPGWLYLGADAWLSTPEGLHSLSTTPLRGAVLAALLSSCEGAVCAASDSRSVDLAALGVPTLPLAGSLPLPEAFAANPNSAASANCVTPERALLKLLAASRATEVA